MSPGTRKNCGAVGALGSRNFASNTACATSALFSNERGVVTTSFCSMIWLPFASLCVTHPATRSMRRTLVVSAKIESPVNGIPGVMSPPGLTPGTFTGAA